MIINFIELTIRMCKNRASGHTKFDHFFKICLPIKVYAIIAQSRIFQCLFIIFILHYNVSYRMKILRAFQY